MKFVMVAGGTGGTVAPLLAVATEIIHRQPEAEITFFGTRTGVERAMVEEVGWPFLALPAGKFRRYFSLRTIIDFFLVLAGLVSAWRNLRRWRPDAVCSGGSYVGVPVVWAARLLHIRSLIHQQDYESGLANRLTRQAATRITVTFERSLRDFPTDKTVWVGNPIREELLTGDRERAYATFSLRPGLPTILVLGGGSGAARVNELMAGAAFRLVHDYQIIHIYGRQKTLYNLKHENYHAYEFLHQEMRDAYAAADLVVCRAGLNTLTEVAALGKPTVLIPLPDSPQVANADIFKQMNAAVVLDQGSIDAEFLVNVLIGLLSNAEWRAVLSHNIRQLVKADARQRLADQLIRLAEGRK